MSEKKIKKQRMNKKAQFYLFTAVLLCSLVFMLVTSAQNFEKPETTFKELYSNYMDEAPQAVNYALFNKLDLISQVDDFNQRFIRYAESKKVRFDVLTILVKENITLFNNLNSPINVTDFIFNFSIDENETMTINKTPKMRVTLEKAEYDFDVGQENVEMKALFRMREKNLKKIHIEN